MCERIQLAPFARAKQLYTNRRVRACAGEADGSTHHSPHPRHPQTPHLNNTQTGGPLPWAPKRRTWPAGTRGWSGTTTRRTCRGCRAPPPRRSCPPWRAREAWPWSSCGLPAAPSPSPAPCSGHTCDDRWVAPAAPAVHTVRACTRRGQPQCTARDHSRLAPPRQRSSAV